jgi:hypothetical protein
MSNYPDGTPTPTMTPESIKRGREMLFVQAAAMFGGALLAAGLIDLLNRGKVR